MRAGAGYLYDAGAQIVRAIGLTIHLNGVMFPSLELLLRHAIQFFSLRGQPHLLEPGEIDYQDRLSRSTIKIDYQD
eukprot:COSAG01_NODE_9660_length_2377_cov_3.470588_5_plen_75_part_01